MQVAAVLNNSDQFNVRLTDFDISPDLICQH